MKLLLIYLTLFFFPLLSFSQINTSLDLVGSIDFAYRNINLSDTPGPQTSIVIDQRNSRESGRLNWRFGFNFNKKITGNLFFKSGLRLANIGYKSNQDSLRWGSQQVGGVFDPRIPSGAPSGTSQFFYNYLFIEIPLAARFEFSQKKLAPFAEIGIAPSLYLKSRNKILVNGKSQNVDGSEDFYDYNKMHFVGIISFGGNYSINEQLQLFAQPTFRYHLTRLINDVPIKENLWTVGLELGFRKRLN